MAQWVKLQSTNRRFRVQKLQGLFFMKSISFSNLEEWASLHAELFSVVWRTLKAQVYFVHMHHPNELDMKLEPCNDNSDYLAITGHLKNFT